MEEDDKGSPMIRMGVSGWMFLLVPAYPGSPGQKAVKRLCVCYPAPPVKHKAKDNLLANSTLANTPEWYN